MATTAEKLTTIAENQQKVYKAGQKDERVKTWEQLQEGGTRNYYSYAFAYSCWTDDIYHPIYDISSTALNYAYYISGITDTKVNIETEGNLVGLFQNSAIKTVRKLKVVANTAFTQAFTNCSNLENIVFDGVIGTSLDLRWSKKLTADSLNSITTHLSDEATGQRITLPTTAEANYNANPPEGAPDTWAKLVATKPNWTFAYA